MRCIYADYVGLHKKYKHVIEPFANRLKSEAKLFYHRTVCGYRISDIAHLPNEILIDEIVLNTMSDLDRIMAYHPVEAPTRYKFAAYTGFWWQRGKPLSCKLHDYDAMPESKSLDPLFIDLCRSLNEMFITDVMLSLTRRRSTKGFCADRSKTFQYADIQDSLLYFLKYRHYTAQELELFLKGLDTCPLII
jgi:hypothetical protein